MSKVAVLGLTGVLFGLFMKEIRPQFSVYISMASCLLIFSYAVSRLGFLGETLKTVQGAVPMDDVYLKILLKMVGVTYLADFTSNLCKDAGYSAIAGQVEFFGKISLLTLSLPVLTALLETIDAFLL
jgi:stage III sporulation protein AD